MKRALALVALAWLAAPRGAWAQAEPAPEDYVPPRERKHEPRPVKLEWKALPQRFELAVSARLTFDLAQAAGLPTLGYGGGVRFHAALLKLGPVRLGLGAQFAYDKFARDKPSAIVLYQSTTQQASHATFAAVVVLDALLWRLRPFVAAGGGFSVSSYFDPSVMGMPPMTVHDDSVLPLAAVSGGVTIEVYEGFEAGLHADGLFVFTSAPWFSPGVVALAADVGFRF